MIASEMPLTEARSAEPPTAEGATVDLVARIGRAALVILGLAGVVALTVSLRFGIYIHFHGDGRLLKGLSDLL
jgi:hypothetical protein